MKRTPDSVRLDKTANGGNNRGGPVEYYSHQRKELLKRTLRNVADEGYTRKQMGEQELWTMVDACNSLALIDDFG